MPKVVKQMKRYIRYEVSEHAGLWGQTVKISKTPRTNARRLGSNRGLNKCIVDVCWMVRIDTGPSVRVSRAETSLRFTARHKYGCCLSKLQVSGSSSYPYILRTLILSTCKGGCESVFCCRSFI